MKNIALLLFALFLYGCSKDGNDFNETTYGISYNYNNVPIDLVEVNLNDGKVTKKSDVSNFDDLGYNEFNAYSRSENLYIYDVDPWTVGIVNLKNLTLEKIDISNDTTLGRIMSILMDDNDKKLFIIASAYKPTSKWPVLSIIPINLITKKIEPKSEITDPTDTLTAYISHIDSRGQRIFIKERFGRKTYIYDYNQNQTIVRSVNVEFLNINYDSERDCLFGATTDHGVYLASYFLESGEIKKTLLKDAVGVMNDCKVYNKNYKYYWQGVLNELNPYKIDLLKIELNSGNIVQKVTLSQPVRGIN